LKHSNENNFKKNLY